MIKTLVYAAVGLVLFVLLGFIFTDIYIYFIISIVLAAILRPLTNRIHRARFAGFKLPRGLSVLFSFVVLIVVFQAFMLLFVPLISTQIEVLSKIDYAGLVDRAKEPIASLEQFMIDNSMTDKKSGFIMSTLKGATLEFVQKMDVSRIINSIILYAGNFLVGLMAVIFITFFLLFESGTLRNKIISLIPNRYFEVTIAAMHKIEKLLSNYLIGLLFQMLAIFTIASVGLTIAGVNYAVTIAVFAAVANLVPYLGPIFGSTFGIIVSIMTPSANLNSIQDYMFLVGKIIAVFAIVQLSDNVLFQPVIFSKSVKVHPLEIFVIIFAAATLAGVLGMVLAIPVYTVLRVSSNELYSGYKQYQIFKL